MSDALLLVSVIIPHYNDIENLARCLEALRHQTLPRPNFEIVVADNNSIGGVAAIERLAGDVRVVPAPVQGAGPARNAAVAVASGKFLAFIDSDCIADARWLEEGMAALDRFDYVGGQVVTSVADPRHVTTSEAFEAVFAFRFKKYIEHDKFSGTGNLFVPRAIFDRVGGFRAGVSEDIEWCRRANAGGFRLGYAERAIVQHAARRDWRELKQKWDRVIAERIRLEREQRIWRLKWIARAVLVGLSPLAHWLSVASSPRLVGLRARFLALLGLVRIRAYRSYRMLWFLVWPPS